MPKHQYTDGSNTLRREIRRCGRCEERCERRDPRHPLLTLSSERVRPSADVMPKTQGQIR